MKKRKHASRKAKPFPTFPVQPPGTFAVDPDDEMVALANSAPPNFTPPEVDLEAIDFSKGPQYRLEDLVAGMTKESRHEEVNWGTPVDALTLRAAAIALPLLKAKEMTIPLVHKMLRDIIRARGEVDSVIATLIPALDPAERKKRMKDMAEFTKQEAARLKVLDELAKQAQEPKMGYGADDPAKPNAHLRHGSGLTREQKLKLEQAGYKIGTADEFLCSLKTPRNQPNFRATIPADRRESFFRLINAHGCTNAVGIQSPRGKGSWSYSFYAPPSAIASIADSLKRRGVRQFSHVPHRRKRMLLPEFKKLMSKKPSGSTQEDLDAVRGDR